MLDHVVRTSDREREEMEDAVDDREEKGVEDLEEVGLRVTRACGSASQWMHQS